MVWRSDETVGNWGMLAPMLLLVAFSSRAQAQPEKSEGAKRTAVVDKSEAAEANESVSPESEASEPVGPSVAAETETSVRAAGDDEPQLFLGGEYRQLNGHTFITIGSSAFLNTAVGFSQGFGVVNFEGVDVAGRRVEPSVLLYNQSLFATAGIVNRVAIDLSLTGLAAIGGDLQSVIVLGGFALADVEAMPKVRILTEEEFGLQLTAGVGVAYGRNVFLRPLAIVEAVAQGGDTSQNLQQGAQQIVTLGQTIDLEPSLMAAWGWDGLGLQLTGGPTFGVAGEVAGNPHQGVGFEVDGSITLDLLPWTDTVPVAALAAYGLDASFGPSELSHNLTAGLFYSGRSNFSVGGMAVLRSQPRLEMLVGQMVMQYYF